MKNEIKIVGITNNDLSGASLIVGDHVASAVSEERFNGIKDYNGWPEQSIQYILNERELALTDIDCVCYGWSTGFSAKRHLDLYFERHALAKSRGEIEETIFKERIAAEIQNDARARDEFDNWIQSNNLISKVRYVGHHESHALGAFSLSPFCSGIAVSCDGRGDYQSLAVFTVENGKSRCLYRQSTMDSFGYLYGRITKGLGFKPNRHEGKILGLAANGGPSGALRAIRDVVHITDGKICFEMGGIYAPFYDRHFDNMATFCNLYSREDIAYAMQTVLVETVTQLIDYYLTLTGHGNIAVAGGVFTNVRLNQKIAELPQASNLFVLPCMGDGGLPLAASAAFCLESGLVRPKLTTMALGPQETEFEIQSRITYDLPDRLSAISPGDDELIGKAVEELAAGGIVGLYRGRSEFGPRALCNRTLLALPNIENISATLNMRLNRSEFMPFAPVLASEFAGRCLEGWHSRDLNSLYMTQTFDCTDEFSASCPEIVHVDGTARPQVVWPDQDPFMYRLLLALYERTGSLSCINTSFNEHECPIVGSLQTAIDAVHNNVCDLLVVNDRYSISSASELTTSANAA